MGRKKYIQLPHDYLSYSQLSLWESDPYRYAALYFDRRDELRYSNPGQEYGKIVADALEIGKDTGDLLTDAAMLLLPKYDVADVAIETEVRTRYGWLKLIGKPDSLNSETQEFLEFKTGKIPWTQKKAQNHPQMLFYAVVIWLKTGAMNTRAHLAWIETECVEGITRPTGHIEVFEVTFTPQDYLVFQARMIKAAKDIEIAWASHVTNPELINF